jgi:hypothetical protein
VHLSFLAGQRPAEACEFLQLGGNAVPLLLRRNYRARRYILRVRRDSSVRLTIPRGGSRAFALEFARKHIDWIERQLARRAAEAAHDCPWQDGTKILFRGEPVQLRVRADSLTTVIEFADQVVLAEAGANDIRPVIENHLWTLAEKELLPRTLQLGAQFEMAPARVLVRNQRSRWGSCSPRRTISLNWRLIHAPADVRDYLIIHELMHLREMNHSARFWHLVQKACPEYQRAEAWLNAHSDLLR